MDSKRKSIIIALLITIPNLIIAFIVCIYNGYNLSVLIGRFLGEIIVTYVFFIIIHSLLSHIHKKSTVKHDTESKPDNYIVSIIIAYIVYYGLSLAIEFLF